MIDEYMLKLAQIRNGYTRKKFGNLTDIEKATHKYDSLCLELIKQLDLYKSVIDEIKEETEKFVEEKQTKTNSCKTFIKYMELATIIREILDKANKESDKDE